jgi:hypothetical protein
VHAIRVALQAGEKNGSGAFVVRATAWLERLARHERGVTRRA